MPQSIIWKSTKTITSDNLSEISQLNQYALIFNMTTLRTWHCRSCKHIGITNRHILTKAINHILQSMHAHMVETCFPLKSLFGIHQQMVLFCQAQKQTQPGSNQRTKELEFTYCLASLFYLSNSLVSVSVCLSVPANLAYYMVQPFTV